MKVTVNADGDIVLDITSGDTESAMNLIDALQSRAANKRASEIRSEVAVQAQTKVGTSNLNAIQYRTWEFLCENDCSAGIHVSAVARGFAISNAAANTRLIVLEKMGYAKRVQRGYYRALTPEGG
jgi:hypothetical protein